MIRLSFAVFPDAEPTGDQVVQRIVFVNKPSERSSRNVFVHGSDRFLERAVYRCVKFLISFDNVFVSVSLVQCVYRAEREKNQRAYETDIQNEPEHVIDDLPRFPVDPAFPESYFI